jgi:hypothetical protein
MFPRISCVRSVAAIAALSLTFTACGDGPSSASSESEAGAKLFVSTTDAVTYTSGELRFLPADSATLAEAQISTDSDTKLGGSAEGVVYVLQRILNNLTCVDAGSFAVLAQNALEAGANPYATAVTNGTGYIAQWGLQSLRKFDPKTCALGETVPVPASEPSVVLAKGDSLLVLMQRLENFVGVNKGLLAVISASTGTVLGQVELKLHNPSAALLDGNTLYIAFQNYNADYSLDVANSGIEVLDLASGTSTVISGEALGGAVASLALDKARGVLYAAVYEAWGSTPVKPVSLAGHTVGDAIPGVVDGFNGLAFDAQSGTLYIADGDYAGPAVKAWNGTTLSTVKDNKESPLAPYSLLVVK